MKKFLSVLLSVLLVFSVVPLSALTAGAEDLLTENNLAYVLNEEGTEATIIGYRGEDTEYFNLEIPAEIDGIPVTAIANEAFSYYEESNTEAVEYIDNLTIPASVTSIGEFVFYYNGGISNITVDEGNPNYSSVNGVLFNKDKTTLIYYPAGYYSAEENYSYTVPDGVTELASGAFTYAYLENLALPDSLVTIGESAFESCSITELTVPEGVTSIGSYAFAYCARLTTLTLPASLTEIGANAFYNDSYNEDTGGYEQVAPALQTIYFNGTEEQWTNVTKGEDVETELTDINIQYVTETTDENNIVYEISADGTTATVIGYQGDDTSGEYVDIDIPAQIEGATVTAIADGAFSYSIEGNSGIYYIMSINIPASVTSIGDYVFQYNSLYTITVDDENPNYSDENGILLNKDKTILICMPSLYYEETDVCTVPDGVTELAPAALCYVYTASVSLPNTLVTIGDNAFDGSYFTEIVIPEGVKTIGVDAFSYCPSLESLTLPASLTDIGDYAFYNDVYNAETGEYDQTAPTLSVINYNGNRLQWDAINKGEDVENELSNVLINCLAADPDPVDPDPATVDKTALKTQLDAAKALQKGSYTDESWEALQTAVTNAQGVYDKDNAEQTEVDAALKALTDAVAALKSYNMGDSNHDNEINATDATLILQYFAKIITDETTTVAFDKAISNVNDDEEINATDATLVLQHFAKIITEFPRKNAA